jgi:hypothetical protein
MVAGTAEELGYWTGWEVWTDAILLAEPVEEIDGPSKLIFHPKSTYDTFISMAVGQRGCVECKDQTEAGRLCHVKDGVELTRRVANADERMDTGAMRRGMNVQRGSDAATKRG